jgi:hypothetical protein
MGPPPTKIKQQKGVRSLAHSAFGPCQSGRLLCIGRNVPFAFHSTLGVHHDASCAIPPRLSRQDFDDFAEGRSTIARPSRLVFHGRDIPIQPHYYCIVTTIIGVNVSFQSRIRRDCRGWWSCRLRCRRRGGPHRCQNRPGDATTRHHRRTVVQPVHRRHWQGPSRAGNRRPGWGHGLDGRSSRYSLSVVESTQRTGRARTPGPNGSGFVQGGDAGYPAPLSQLVPH